MQRKLWQWLLRWGEAVPAAKRQGFWRWALRAAPEEDGAAASLQGGASFHTLTTAILDAAMRVNTSGLLRLSQGLAGTSLGACIAATICEHVSRELNVSSVVGDRSSVPREILVALLDRPFCAQQFWMLSSDGLPWLVAQCRAFQIEFAAHCPQLFRHFMAEGLAPELFYCWWLQRLFHGCARDDELLRLWDLFIFERSHKIFVRTAIALFGLLSPRLRGDVDQIMKVLFSPETWGLHPGALLVEALSTKVTRLGLREICEESVLGGKCSSARV